MKSVKNIILFLSVILCVYLSSQVWLVLPDFLLPKTNQNLSANEDSPSINVWSVVRPNKFLLKADNKLTEFFIDENSELWFESIKSLENAFANFLLEDINILNEKYLPEEYILFEFKNALPAEIFYGSFDMLNTELTQEISNIKHLVMDISSIDTIYVFDGESTYELTNPNIDNTPIFEYIYSLQSESNVEFQEHVVIGDEIVPVSIPQVKNARNPIFVESEFDIQNEYLIENMAKGYFGNNYDYVRKSQEIQGDLLYVYKNETILKISPEGLLDFYDSTVNVETDTANMYESLETALKFTTEFLGFHESMYLTEVIAVEHNGRFGFEFIFSYKVFDTPIIFSKVRNTEPLEVTVIGENVISYKRLMRNIDIEQSSKMQNMNILSFEEVLKNQVEPSTEAGFNVLRVIDATMIKDITDVYLGYFDYGRSISDQQLIVVWIVEIGDKSFIFNAITGALIEEQS